MGLDITAYGKLNPLPIHEFNDTCWAANHVRLHANEGGFVERQDGLAEGCYKLDSKKQEIRFRAGSYSGYNWWRAELSKMAYGFEPQVLWDGKITEGPFYEIINFSDCEGFIGHVTSAKLSKDFADYASKAEKYAAKMQYGGAAWLETYKKFRDAFELAATGGAVEFH